MILCHGHHSSLTLKALAAAAVLLAFPASAAGPQGAEGHPDFTKGEPIPEHAKHDWNLGTTGARGWMISDKLVTTDARQIKITETAKGSPADGVLVPGDVILGVGGKPFSYDPRTEFGKALTAAESADGGGRFRLTRWRDGMTEDVTIQLRVLGSYSATAPSDCPKSARILASGCEALAKRMAEAGYPRSQNPITRSLNALALLASGEASYLPLVKSETQWAAAFSANSMQTWYYSYLIMLLAEYQMVTGDDSVMPGLRRLVIAAVEGQSMVGSWGHGFAGADGRLGGYGMMNSTGGPMTIALVMARSAGIDLPEVSDAIERSTKLLRFYAGKGAVPYGDHAPWIQTHEDNGKCGMAAILFNLLGEPASAEFFSRMSLASHGAERDCGHTGNFFNLLFALPAVAHSGPQATGAWMHEFGAWYFDLARRWDGSFAHLGPPQLRNDSYAGWDCSGSYLLAYATPLKTLWLTGKQPAITPQLDASTARRIVLDGRGWSNKDRNSSDDALREEELFERLGSWSPVVRERAAAALARRDHAPVDALVKLLGSASPEARLGACQALAQLKAKAAPAVPVLREALKADDLWLRIKAAEALATIGKPAMAAVPELLEMLSHKPTPEDPRNMQQRYLCFSVFGTMLKNSLDGVDRELLRKAVAAGLHNQDGRARGAIGGIYQKLTYEEIEPLLPAIHEAIVTPAPSGIMFAGTIRVAGLEVLAKHRIKEGIPLCFEVMELEKWGKNDRIMGCLNALARYGSAATEALPRLRQLEQELVNHREAKMLAPHAEKTRTIIRQIESATESIQLRSLH